MQASRRHGLEAIETAAVDERLPTPLYHQIYLVLRDKIVDGSYALGDRLPSEQELMRQFGVSRITAKRAMDELADARLVVRGRGRGTVVSYVRPAEPIRSGVEGLLENLLMMGFKTQVELIELAYVRPSDDVARRLAVPRDSLVQRAVRLRKIGGEPFSHLTTHVPEDVGHAFGRRELARQPLLALLERAGVVITSAEQTISATLADAQIAPLLGVDVGTPLLRVVRVVHDQNGRAVELLAALYRPDRYQMRMRLSRVHGNGHASWEPASFTVRPDQA